jgi:flagellar basal body rod protein FlgB
MNALTDNVKVAIAIALAVLAFVAGWAVNGWRMQSTVATLEADYATARAEAAEAETRGYQRAKVVFDENLNKAEEAADEARTKLKTALADADSARAAVRRLQEYANGLAGRADSANGSALASGGEDFADTEAGYLLADMLARHSRELVEVGEYADRLRVAGETCERIYDGVSAAQ